MNKYPTVSEAEDAGLFHPNCEHRLNRYLPGITKLEEVTEDQQIKSEEYREAREQQRYMERQIRHWKRREVASIDREDALKCRDKWQEWSEKLKEHTEINALIRRRNREGIGKTRYGNSPTHFGGTQKYLVQRAKSAYENFTGEKASAEFTKEFVLKMKNVTDYTIIRKEVFEYLQGR